jgi:glycosyltransferase involved in cell wall biosynthesis
MVRKNRFASADGLIAISARSRKDIIEAGICPEKIHLIYDSIDTDVFRPMPNARERFISNGDFVFGLVGRIEPAKYQMEFVLAAEHVAVRHKNVKFVLVGQAWNRTYAEKIEHFIKNAGLSDRIVFYGRREEMPEVLSSFDVLVSLSGGSVMYEALACGVPVLSAGYTRKEDSVHIIHDYNAMLVENREPDSLVRAMERMLEDSRYLHALAENTRPHVLSHLTDSIMAERTEAVYRTILDRRYGSYLCSH